MAWEISGQLIEACSCKALCPCYLGPAEPDQGWCSGALTFSIRNGQSEGVDLSGRAVVWLIDLPKDFVSGNGTARLYIDDAASAVWSAPRFAPPTTAPANAHRRAGACLSLGRVRRPQ